MIFIGDIHGDFNGIVFEINKFNIKNKNFIQVGDFGIGFSKNDLSLLKQVNENLIKKNCMLYVCRGNHDNPLHFDIELWDRFSNIKFVPDYTVLKIENKKVLFIGGGISIDRTQRTVNVSYWENEKILFNLDKVKEIAAEINIIVSHSAPKQFTPQIEGQIVYTWAKYDFTLLEELREERNKFQELCDEIIKLNPKRKLKWFYGHFHHSKQGLYKNITYRLLDCNEWFELKK